MLSGGATSDSSLGAVQPIRVGVGHGYGGGRMKRPWLGPRRLWRLPQATESSQKPKGRWKEEGTAAPAGKSSGANGACGTAVKVKRRGAKGEADALDVPSGKRPCHRIHMGTCTDGRWVPLGLRDNGRG
jgi:hypothetical protein